MCWNLYPSAWYILSHGRAPAKDGDRMSHECTTSNLFDLSVEYDAMLYNGIRLSGENADYFVRGRVDHLAARIEKPRRILDFGCGVGRTAAYLAALFPSALVVGADTSANALKYAADRYSS